RKGQFDDIVISPGGEYFAATVPLDDRTALVVMQREAGKVTGTVNPGKNTHISDFTWVSDRTVLVGTSRKFGSLDQPLPTGNLYSVDAEGGSVEILVGQDVDEQAVGSRISRKKAEAIAAFLVDE